MNDHEIMYDSVNDNDEPANSNNINPFEMSRNEEDPGGMFANSGRARAHSHGHAHDCRHGHAHGYYHGHKKYIIGIAYGLRHGHAYLLNHGHVYLFHHGYKK